VTHAGVSSLPPPILKTNLIFQIDYTISLGVTSPHSQTLFASQAPPFPLQIVPQQQHRVAGSPSPIEGTRFFPERSPAPPPLSCSQTSLPLLPPMRAILRNWPAIGALSSPAARTNRDSENTPRRKPRGRQVRLRHPPQIKRPRPPSLPFGSTLFSSQRRIDGGVLSAFSTRIRSCHSPPKPLSTGSRTIGSRSLRFSFSNGQTLFRQSWRALFFSSPSTLSRPQRLRAQSSLSLSACSFNCSAFSP